MPIRLYLEESPLEKMKKSGEKKFPNLRINWEIQKTEQIYPKSLANKYEDKRYFCHSDMILKDGSRITLDIASKGLGKSIGHDKAECYVELWDCEKENIKEIEEYFSPVLDTRESSV